MECNAKMGCGDGNSGGMNHDIVDFTVNVVGGVQNVIGEAAGRAELISKVAAKRIAFVGVAYTAIDIAHASLTGNLNTSHKIDGTITAVFAGFALFNPSGLFALPIYGGARLIGGAAFDEMINEQFPTK
jgi:hypothetical protein